MAMKRGVLGFWGVMLLAVAALYAWRQSATVAEESVDPAVPRQVIDVALTERSGKTVHPADLQGKVWIANFFFANCPGVCTKLSQGVASLQDDLTDPDLQFVSITVDPEHDTPEQLSEYADRFKADPDRWWFLTGTMDDIRRLAEKSFQVGAGPGQHSDRLFLIDRHGEIRGSFHGSEEHEVAALSTAKQPKC